VYFSKEISLLASGVPSTIGDDGEAYANEGIREVVRRIIAFAPQEINMLATTITLVEGSVETWDDTGYPVLAVSREGSVLPVIEQPYSAYPLFSNTGSIHCRTIADSVYYNVDGVYNLYPPLGDHATATVTKITTSDVSNFSGASSIRSFPVKYEWSVVLYAAARVLLVKMNELNMPTSITPISSPSISYAAFSPSNVTEADLTAMDTAIDALVALTNSFSIAQANSYIVTDEDSELASIELNRQRVELENFSTDVQRANARLQSCMGRIDATLKDGAATQDADKTNAYNEFQALTADFGATVQKYMGDLQSYSAQAQAIQSEFSQLAQKYQTLRGEFEMSVPQPRPNGGVK